MTPHARLAGLRDSFVRSGSLPSGAGPVRPEIAASWHRSRSAGALRHPRAPAATSPFDATLVRAAETVSRVVHPALTARDTALLVVNAHGRVVFRSSGPPALEPILREVLDLTGAGLSEASAGTNAWGTALEVGDVTMVDGAEHYAPTLDGLVSLACPVLDPLEQIRGAVGLAAPLPVRGTNDDALVRLLASTIGSAFTTRRTHAPAFPRQSRPPVLDVPEYRGWSPVVQRTAIAMRRAAEQRRPTLVSGEPGVGKSTMVRLVAARALPGRNLLRLAPGEVTQDRVAHGLESGRPVLLDQAHLLDEPLLLGLVGLAREIPRGWLVLAMEPSDRAPSATLHATGVKTLPVPPLRTRATDLERALPSMLRRQAGGRDLSVSAALVERLMREPWPTNFTGVSDLIAALAHSATGPVLEVADLPAQMQGVRRRLTPIEWLTRSAIVEALESSGGDKGLAAESLGLSRASIYRKIKALDIDAQATADPAREGPREGAEG